MKPQGQVREVTNSSYIGKNLTKHFLSETARSRALVFGM